MKASISSITIDANNEEKTGLSPILEGLSVDEKPFPVEINANGNSITVETSARSSMHENENDKKKSLLRPFIDPTLIVRKTRSVEETWLKDFKSPSSAPQSAYSPITQAVKKLLPERTACRLGCSGANCKYERSDYWGPEQMAIQGIFSTWITDSILACSRPTQKHSELKKLFYDAGIRAIFNLELPDEHVSCGHGNHESGFSYDPKEFMDVGIFIYNFAMEDYGTVKVETILDIMKVMGFAMKQGKVAVHCHAGLGRTGFVICAYLVHEYRMTAHESIHYIRGKRPGSVQMKKQIEAVVDYEKFIRPKRVVFTECADVTEPLTIEHHLQNQQAFTHGRDSQIFKFIPRIIFICAARLVSLCSGFMIDTILLTINRRSNIKPIFPRNDLNSFTDEEKRIWLDFAPSFFYENEHFSTREFLPAKKILQSMITAMSDVSLSSMQQAKIIELKRKINNKNHGVDEIFDETDPAVISALMWSWMLSLKLPVIKSEDLKRFTHIESHHQLSVELLSHFSTSHRGTIEVLAKMFAFLRKFADADDSRLLLQCIIHCLTHHRLPATNELKTLASSYQALHFLVQESTGLNGHVHHSNKEPLSETTLNNLVEFFSNISKQFEQ